MYKIVSLLFFMFSLQFSFASDELIQASYDGDLKSVQALIEQGADVNYSFYGVTVLMASVLGSQASVVEYLVKQEGIDLNKQDEAKRTALIYAAAIGNPTTTSLLLNANADLEVKDQFENQAIDHAKFSKNLETLQLIYKKALLK